MEDPPIEGKRLTSWTVAPDGLRVRLGLADENGQVREISLPVEMLHSSMTTIPRMLSVALGGRFADGLPRVIHQLGDWRVESTADADTSILSLAAADGFEVAFAVDAPDAEKLGETLRDSADGGVVKRFSIN